MERACGEATLVIEPFESLSKENHDAQSEEGRRLVRFVGYGAKTFEVRFDA